jgi:predicted small lipoprotein YifL
MPRNALHLTLALTLVAGLGLSGCGRKGKLEPPPEQNVPAGKQGSQFGKKKIPGFDKPQRTLPMDFLLN